MPSTTRPAPPPAAPVRVTLLGVPAIEVSGTPVTGLRAKARELVTYLALHPDGVGDEPIVDALWSDQPPDPGNIALHSALRSARTGLRKATAARGAMFLIYTNNRYRLDASLIATDLWDFHTALRAAVNEAPSAADHLRRAVELYRGPLADGEDYAWIEPHREALRRQAVDAHTRLATLLQDAEPDQALAVLNRALDHDPHNEELYGRIMRIQARLGQTDAVRRTYRLLETRLTTLDTDPSEATNHLLARLLHSHNS